MATKTRKNYKHHMMYPPNGGAGRMTASFSDHLKLRASGWGHSKPNPLKKRVVAGYKKKKSSNSGY